MLTFNYPSGRDEHIRQVDYVAEYFRIEHGFTIFPVYRDKTSEAFAYAYGAKWGVQKGETPEQRKRRLDAIDFKVFITRQTASKDFREECCGSAAICGVEHNMIAVDIDTKHAKTDADKLAIQDMTISILGRPSVISKSGGLHYVYSTKKWQPPVNRKLQYKGMNIEVQMKGQILFLPGTLASEGRMYRPFTGNIEDCVIDLNEEIWAKIEGMLSVPNTEDNVKRAFSIGSATTIEYTPEEIEVIDGLKSGEGTVPVGMQDNLCSKLLSSMRYAKATEQEALDFVNWYHSRCDTSDPNWMEPRVFRLSPWAFNRSALIQRVDWRGITMSDGKTVEFDPTNPMWSGGVAAAVAAEIDEGITPPPSLPDAPERQPLTKEQLAALKLAALEEFWSETTEGHVYGVDNETGNFYVRLPDSTYYDLEMETPNRLCAYHHMLITLFNREGHTCGETKKFINTKMQAIWSDLRSGISEVCVPFRVSSQAYYDAQAGECYILCNKREYIKIVAGSYEVVSNIPNDIIIKNPYNATGQRVLPLPSKQGDIGDFTYLLLELEDKFRVSRGDLVGLLAWLVCCFMTPSTHNKILAAVGPTNVGKSYWIASVLYLLGLNYQMSEPDATPLRVGAAMAALTATPTIAVPFDNFEYGKVPQGVIDIMLQVANRGSIPLRVLYKTNVTAHYKPKCSLMISAKVNSFERDMQDRSLSVEIMRNFDKYVPMSTVLSYFVERHSEILTLLYTVMSEYLKNPVQEAQFDRFVEWRGVVEIISSMYGEGKDEIIEYIDNEQRMSMSRSVIESNILFEALEYIVVVKYNGRFEGYGSELWNTDMARLFDRNIGRYKHRANEYLQKCSRRGMGDILRDFVSYTQGIGGYAEVKKKTKSTMYVYDFTGTDYLEELKEKFNTIEGGKKNAITQPTGNKKPVIDDEPINIDFGD